jgi:hypothetical protein
MSISAMKQEPVAWREVAGKTTHYYDYNEDGRGEPLYAAPQKRDSLSWVGLTDEEIWAEGADNVLDVYFARDIEAKLKEKNGFLHKNGVECSKTLKDALELQEVVKQFFERYLNRVEESDSGRAFNPVTIGCCRSLMIQPLHKILERMRELSGAKPNPLYEETT